MGMLCSSDIAAGGVLVIQAEVPIHLKLELGGDGGAGPKNSTFTIEKYNISE
jgi:hypothetical protein